MSPQGHIYWAGFWRLEGGWKKLDDASELDPGLGREMTLDHQQQRLETVGMAEVDDEAALTLNHPGHVQAHPKCYSSLL